MDPHPEIVTERLILRPLASEHASALHAIYSNPAAMRFWHTPPHVRLEETLALIDQRLTPSERSWALILPEIGNLAIGQISFLGNPGTPGMGYILDPAYWGKGLMSEAIQAALAYGFASLDFARVELWIAAENRASQRLAERNGFKRRADFLQRYPHRPTVHQTLVYGLQREEWPNDVLLPAASALRQYSLQPVLGVPDVLATAEYYRDQLGFTISFLFGQPPAYGAVALSEWTATGARLRFARIDGCSSVKGLSLYLQVGPDVRALHQKFVARGVEVEKKPERMPWGSFEFVIRDCNGYLLTFATPD